MSSHSKTDIWMPLYIADYLTDTSRLTTLQHGAYMLLIMDYWRNGALPDDDFILAQVTRMTADAWSIARGVIGRFFSIENGSWVHKRIEEEMKKAGANSQKAHDRAVKAAAARWGKENAPSIAPSVAQEVLNECPSPSPSPSPSKSKSKDIGAAFALPDWIDKTQWDLWMKTRKGKKMIVEQMQAQVDKLCKWRDAGLDHCGALANAAANGYTGLFLPDKGKPPSKGYSGVQEARLECARQIMGGAKNGTDRQIIDITPTGSDSRDRARIPEIFDGVREPTFIEVGGD